MGRTAVAMDCSTSSTCSLSFPASPMEHCRSLLRMLKDVPVLYNSSQVRFFVDDLWKHIPHEWSSALLSCTDDEFIQLPFGLLKDEWPASLCEFLMQCQSLGLSRNPTKDFSENVRIPPSFAYLRGVTHKKFHEVARLSGRLISVCRQVEANIVVDIGAGAGYLCQILKANKLQPIGVEGDDSNCVSAIQRSQAAKRNHKHTKHRQLAQKKGVKEDDQNRGLMDGTNATSLSREVEQESLDYPVIGCRLELNLHDPSAAEELMRRISPAMENSNDDVCGRLRNDCVTETCMGEGDFLFTETTAEESHVPFSPIPTHRSSFRAFPMSHSLARMMEEEQVYLSLSALNLSTHTVRRQTSEAFQNRLTNMLYRCALEKYLRSNFHLPHTAFAIRLKRPCRFTLQEYVAQAANKMWLIDTSTGNAAWSKADPDQFAMVERMQEIHAIYQHQCEQVAKIKAFQALQLCIQNALESLIVMDRVTYLQEQCCTASVHFKVEPLFDSEISPRNLAIVGLKHVEA